MIRFSKRFSALICAALLVLCTSVSVFAETTYKYRDDADIFTDDEDSLIASQLESATDYTGWDIIIYTNTNDVSESSIDDYCNDFYIQEGFGIGVEDSGVMLTVDMSSRAMNILTKGDAQEYFDDERTDLILDDVTFYLSAGDYYGASQAFIDGTRTYYDEGIPVGGTYTNIEYDDADLPFVYILGYFAIALIIASGVAVLSVVFVKLRYKNHGRQGTYDLKGNSVTKLTDSQDVFLTKSVTVTTVSSSSGSSGHSSGGHSSHGGGSRSF